MTMLLACGSENSQLISNVILNAVVTTLWSAQRYDSTQLTQPFKGVVEYIFQSSQFYGHY